MQLAAISWTFGLSDLEELFSKAQSIGYKAIQYCEDFDKYSAEDVLAVADKFKIQVVGYDPFNCQPSSEKEATLDNSVTFYKKVIDYAEALKVPMATIQGLSTWVADHSDYANGIKQIIAAIKQLSAYAKTKDILLTYEACNHYEVPFLHTAEELIYIIEQAEVDNVKAVLDSFHMNIDEPDPQKALANFPADLLYSYHVSDSGRGGIGTGHIDFEEHYNLLKKSGFDGLVCFEIVIPTCRPDKLPMNSEQMQEFMRQSKDSLQAWRAL
ncbi:sugar phosphate isomerase/epimerase family protein [Fulvivirga ligni]|uniref:sugar phosphate isomerase/epimerase family protein n=1 Tax=Fulvivirga ligni TaxID=2904246 RepID=UPI001F328257|nr:sugar phosphate isomerase/epimerase family protein [Fulvivirga ligni]UII22262.1 sugar phosphate isomerase/epimerase [Fulvivirga ligni]